MNRVTKLFPVFTVRDLGEALEYYRDKLGFTISWTWGAPVSRAGVALDDVEIQLEGAGLGAPPGPSVVYCHMTGVDSYYEACRGRGATVAMERSEWKSHWFRVCLVGAAQPAVAGGRTPRSLPSLFAAAAERQYR